MSAVDRAGGKLRRHSYCAITPVRTDAENLERLAAAMRSQTLRPTVWLIVDNGSTDGTVELANRLSEQEEWIAVTTSAGNSSVVRGAPIVRAFHAGLKQLHALPDVVVKLDADVSFEREYFDELIRQFEEDPRLGIASGTCYEWEGGAWRPRFATRSQVRGATRAYRRECLNEIGPLEERMGWDSVDQLAATSRGWRTASFRAITFRHHRVPGERDGALRGWKTQGEVAHYLGYRFSYLLLRAAYRAVRDPRATTMLAGYIGASIRREPRHPDASLRRLLRSQQSIRVLHRRIREALGREDAPKTEPIGTSARAHSNSAGRAEAATTRLERRSHDSR